MTYEWGYTYGPAMAVAPINNVKAVLDYAITEIPPEKIYMGIPIMDMILFNHMYKEYLGLNPFQMLKLLK